MIKMMSLQAAPSSNSFATCAPVPGLLAPFPPFNGFTAPFPSPFAPVPLACGMAAATLAKRRTVGSLIFALGEN